MNRRGFLRSLFASTATIVIAPACALDELPAVPGHDPHRTYFDMGRDGGVGPTHLQWATLCGGVAASMGGLWIYAMRKAARTHYAQP